MFQLYIFDTSFLHSTVCINSETGKVDYTVGFLKCELSLHPKYGDDQGILGLKNRWLLNWAWDG